MLLLSTSCNLMSNFWLHTTDSDYIIPEESGYSKFISTVMNSGSGNWWIYGEDDNNYYYFVGNESLLYIYISRNDSLKISNFNKHDYRTWNLGNLLLKKIDSDNSF